MDVVKFLCLLNQNIPAKLLLSECLQSDGLTVEVQEAVVDVFVRSPLIPLTSSRYLTSIIKQLIKQGEDGGHEATEPLVEILASAITTIPASEWNYRTYTYSSKRAEEIGLEDLVASLGLHQRRIECFQTELPLPLDSPPIDSGDSQALHHVTLRVSDNVLGGSTGFNAWEASFVMVEWLLNQGQGLFDDSCDILELGCGLGLTGICLARHLPHLGTHIILTDGNPEVVAAASHNLQLNGINAGDNGQVACRELFWTSIAEEEYARVLKREPQDCQDDLQAESGRVKREPGGSVRPLVILASDVLYDPLLYPQLIALITSLLDLSPSQCQVFIFTTLRQEESFIEFIRQAKERGLDLDNSLIRGTAPSSVPPMDVPLETQSKVRFIHRLNPLEASSSHVPPIILTRISRNREIS